MPPGGAASDAPEHSCEHDGQNVSEVAEGCKEGHRQPVTAKPSLLSGRRLGEESQPTARRTNASRPVRIAWGRFGTCLVQRLSRASQVYWPAPSWLFFTKPGRRTAPLVATKDEGDCAARACLARTHAHGAHRRPTLWHRVWPGRSYAIVLVRPCLSYRILTSIGETAGVRCRSHAAKL